MPEPSTPSLLDAHGQLLPVWQFLAFHNALRRDAARFHTALAQMVQNNPNALAEFQAHWRNYRLLLDWHHEVEDQSLFPLMRQRGAHLEPVLDRLDTEHTELDKLLPVIADAIDQLPQDDALHTAQLGIERLGELLEPHLSAEEQHVVPELLAWIAEQPDQPGDTTEASDHEAGPPEDEGPVPDEFAYPWTLEGLDDHIIGLALEALPEPVRSQYPHWRQTYQNTVARWARD